MTAITARVDSTAGSQNEAARGRDFMLALGDVGREGAPTFGAEAESPALAEYITPILRLSEHGEWAWPRVSLEFSAEARPSRPSLREKILAGRHEVAERSKRWMEKHGDPLELLRGLIKQADPYAPIIVEGLGVVDAGDDTPI
jgi:hypothetical protein